MRTIRVKCPAKINLYLEITGKRPDGYHDLKTVFAKISLCDFLGVSLREKPGGEKLEIINNTGIPLSAGPDNLVVRAARAFKQTFGIPNAVVMKLVKNIPMGAGLGGGSSDAAGVLLAMAGLCGFGRESRQWLKLQKIAAGLGADVPFFLRPGTFCLGEGIGDRLRPLKTSGKLPGIALLSPDVHIPTAGVYKALKLPAKSETLTTFSRLDTLKKALKTGGAIKQEMLFNRLESVVLPAQKKVVAAKRVLQQAGAAAVLMSGSGSSVFGLFAPGAKLPQIKRAGMTYFKCSFLA